MIELAEHRVAKLGPSFQERVRFHHMDVREFEAPPGAYDLVVTHFFLDCFSEAELPNVVSLLISWATPQTQWLLSDFREAEGFLGRAWTCTVIRSLYAAFRLTTGLRVTRLPGYRAALLQAGFCACREENAVGGLLHSSLWKARG